MAKAEDADGGEQREGGEGGHETRGEPASGEEGVGAERGEDHDCERWHEDEFLGKADGPDEGNDLSSHEPDRSVRAERHGDARDRDGGPRKQGPEASSSCGAESEGGQQGRQDAWIELVNEGAVAPGIEPSAPEAHGRGLAVPKRPWIDELREACRGHRPTVGLCGRQPGGADRLPHVKDARNKRRRADESAQEESQGGWRGGTEQAPKPARLTRGARFGVAIRASR